MNKILFFVVVSLVCFNNTVFSIDLSEYSKEERKQYKQIKKLKEEGFTGKNYIKWGENPYYAYINGSFIKGYYYYKNL